MANSMNKRQAAVELLAALEDLLKEVPAVARVERKSVRQVKGFEAFHPDGLWKIALKGGGSKVWVLEVKSLPLEPRMAEAAAVQVRRYLEAAGGHYGVVMAPFISPRSAELLKREGLGFCDLSGNCRLVSGPLFIERSGLPNVQPRKAQHGNLFTPGAERILRALLDPTCAQRAWTLRDLAEASYPGVSLGQVHKVVGRLEEQAYMVRSNLGLRVRDPARLLEAWAGNYRFSRNREHRYYSSLKPADLRIRFGDLVGGKTKRKRAGALASFSAADVQAPQVRQFRFFAYWQGDGSQLASVLELKPVSSGDNVVIYSPYDEGVFYPASDWDEPVTAPVQTYLDLRASASRGEEAAEAVFEKHLKGAYEA